jgi:uncharacterized protein YegP (UPF0339 family)
MRHNYCLLRIGFYPFLNTYNDFGAQVVLSTNGKYTLSFIIANKNIMFATKGKTSEGVDCNGAGAVQRCAAAG